MKKHILIALFGLASIGATAQEIETYSIDSIGRHNWQLSTTLTVTRADSTVSVRKESVKFTTRKDARKYISALFADKIRADSAVQESAKRRIALYKTSRTALLSDLNRAPTQPKNVQQNTRSSGTVPTKKQKK
jgi:hypothetical protein